MPDYSVNPWAINPAMLKQLQDDAVGMAYTSPPPDRYLATPAVPKPPPRVITKTVSQPRIMAGMPQPSERTLSDNELLRQMLAAQQADADEAKGRANEFAAEPLQTDLSPLASLVDSWYGSKLSQGYKKPMGADEKMMTLAKLREMAANEQAKVNEQQLKKMLGGEKNDTALLRAFLTGERQTNSAGEKQGKTLDKMSKDFEKSLDTYQKSQGAVGLIGTTGVKASKLAALINQYPNGNLTKQEMTDLGAGLASLVIGQNRVPYELVKDLVPTSAYGSVADLQSWLSNKPKGREQQEFVKRFSGTVEREKELAEQQMHALRLKHVAGHQSLFETAPDRMYRIARQYGVNPQEVSDVFSQNLDEPLTNYKELPGPSDPNGFYNKSVTPGATGKVELKRQQNKDGTKIKIIYTDGTSEVKDVGK